MKYLFSFYLCTLTRIIQRPLSAVATVNEAIDSEWNITTGLFGLCEPKNQIRFSENYFIAEKDREYPNRE